MNESTETLVERGINLHVLGQLKEAMDCFAEVMGREQPVYDATGEASDNYVQALGQAAGICQKWKQYENALHFSSSAVRFRPSSSKLWVIHGNSELFLEHNEAAEQAFDNAIGADRYDASGWAMKSRLLLERGDVMQAIRHARRAIDLDRSLGLAHVLLGLAELRRGDVELAEASLRRALEINPDDSFAKQAMKELKGIGNQPADADNQKMVDAKRAALVRKLARGPVVADKTHLPQPEGRQSAGSHSASRAHTGESVPPKLKQHWWQKLF